MEVAWLIGKSSASGSGNPSSNLGRGKKILIIFLSFLVKLDICGLWRFLSVSNIADYVMANNLKLEGEGK